MVKWTVGLGLDSSLLAELSNVWLSEPGRNPFSAPSFVRVMSLHADAAGARPVLALGRSDQGRLVAFWPLLLDRRGVLSFLQHEYSDHRTCVGRPELGERELALGLVEAISTLSPASVRLTNVPSWGPTLAAACEAFRQVGWRYRAFRAWPCPVLRVDPGPTAGDSLRKEINRHKRVRGYANSLTRSDGFALEILQDATDLDEWCRDFCDTHEWRWNATYSPSQYRFPRARTLFRDVLGAWVQDGVLIRFTIRLASGRAAFVVALQANRRLLYHHVATSPIAERLRAGHVLIRLIGLWMSEHQFDVLDFGAGGEEYKRRYANSDERLWRVYAGRRAVSVAYVRGLVETHIRGSHVLQGLWDYWTNAFIRGMVSQWIGDLRVCQRIFTNVRWRYRWRMLLRPFRDRVTGKREILYRAFGLAGSADPAVAVTELETFDVLTMLEKERGLLRWERVAAYECQSKGARLLGIKQDGRVQIACWLTTVDPPSVPTWTMEGAKAVMRIAGRIESCRTRESHLYRRVLKGILATLQRDQIAVVHAEKWDAESQQDILHAGFEPFAVMVTRPASNRRVFEPYRASGKPLHVHDSDRQEEETVEAWH